MVLLVAAPPVAVMIALLVVLTAIIVCVAIACLCREQKRLEFGAAFVKIPEKAAKCSAVTTEQVRQTPTAATDYGIVSRSIYEKLPMAVPTLDVAEDQTGSAATAALDVRGDYSCVQTSASQVLETKVTVSAVATGPVATAPVATIALEGRRYPDDNHESATPLMLSADKA